MISFFRKRKLAFITIVYWFLLVFIVAAWVWWFISLEKQNNQMFAYRSAQLNKDDPAYSQKLFEINDQRERKTAQFISEGITFLLVTLVGAVFVYRATKRQIMLSMQQQNFMMSVTHELKTPIAVTQLNLETLQKRKLDEMQQHKLITVALQETNRLNVLTNNILIAAQLESGNYIMNKQQVNFSELVNGCTKDFAARFPKRIIHSDIHENIFTEGEAMLLQMLVNNLLENADKYSPPEKAIRLTLKQEQSKIFLKIIDEGGGITDTEKKKVFEKFYRSGNEATRTTKGTGLGLYLCKRIVQDHQGNISLRDNTPHGCIFTVTLNIT